MSTKSLLRIELLTFIVGRGFLAVFSVATATNSFVAHGAPSESKQDLAARKSLGNEALLIPHVSRPWDDALCIVGHGDKFHNDFSLIKDNEGTWHCIGSGGRDGSLDTLFHAQGATLNKPFEYLPKITSQTDPKAVHMWAPFAIKKDDNTSRLYQCGVRLRAAPQRAVLYVGMWLRLRAHVALYL